MHKTKGLQQVLGENVLEVRRHRKLAQTGVATAAKSRGYAIDQTTVSRVERSADPELGIDPPTLATVEAIAAGLSVSAWQLLVPGLDPKSLPQTEHGALKLSPEELSEVEQVRKLLDDLKPAQRDMLIESDELKKLVTGPHFPSERMSPAWDASSKRKR